MKLKKTVAAVNIALFFGMIIILAAATLIMPKADFSELENRYLAEKPSLGARQWFSGEYSADLGDYLR